MSAQRAREFLRVALMSALLGGSSAAANDVQEASKLLRAGQPEKALEQVDKVLAAKPRDPQARFLKGVILTERGDAKSAVDIFQKLTQDYPELPEPYNNLAVIFAAQGKYDKARSALEQSIRTHPSYATAYENLGDVYAKLASQAYDRALQLDSSNTGAQNKLALVRDLVGGNAEPARVAAAKPVSVAATSTPKAAPASTPVAPPTPPAAAVKSPAPSAPAAPPTPKPADPAAVASATPASAAAPAAAAKPEEAVQATIESWARAWSKQDVEAYLSHYARNFKTPRGMSRTAWESQRRSRVGGPKQISVELSDTKITIDGAMRASATFSQAYRSDRLKSDSVKTLDLVRESGQWRIEQEKVSN